MIYEINYTKLKTETLIGSPESGETEPGKANEKKWKIADRNLFQKYTGWSN
jgi:hypothetical protein